jgi:hypothetical protein
MTDPTDEFDPPVGEDGKELTEDEIRKVIAKHREAARDQFGKITDRTAITLRLPIDLLGRIDGECGDVPRNRWIVSQLETTLDLKAQFLELQTERQGPNILFVEDIVEAMARALKRNAAESRELVATVSDSSNREVSAA